MRAKSRGTVGTAIAKTRHSPATRVNRHALSSPAEATLALQRTIGNLATRKLFRLTDRVARTPGQSTVPDVTPTIESQITNLDGGGRPLPDSVRSFFEPRFGQDFSHVRLHTDAAARESARAVDAAAYTVGRNVVMGEGQYSPDTAWGKRLIAHELTHVVQQAGAHSTLQRQPSRAGLCAVTPSSELSPREWLRCVREGHLQADDADPLRFTFTGEKATAEALQKWMKREEITKDVALKRLASSHEFSGTRAAYEAARDAFLASVPMEKLSICIRPLQIADDDGKNPTTLPSFDAAIAIWKKCCIDVSVKGATKVSKTAFKTLHHDPGTGRATSEQARMIRMAGGSECVSVYVAATFEQGGKIGKDIDGGAAAFGTPGLGEAIVTVEGVDPTIIAHELGHSMGYPDHWPPGTVMEVKAPKHDQKESDKVAWPLCERVRKSFKSTGAREDCYFDAT
jgi:hypothetical protein